jgi:hypothetical protein
LFKKKPVNDKEMFINFIKNEKSLNKVNINDETTNQTPLNDDDYEAIMLEVPNQGTFIAPTKETKSKINKSHTEMYALKQLNNLTMRKSMTPETLFLCSNCQK